MLQFLSSESLDDRIRYEKQGLISLTGNICSLIGYTSDSDIGLLSSPTFEITLWLFLPFLKIVDVELARELNLLSLQSTFSLIILHSGR